MYGIIQHINQEDTKCRKFSASLIVFDRVMIDFHAENSRLSVLKGGLSSSHSCIFEAQNELMNAFLAVRSLIMEIVIVNVVGVIPLSDHALTYLLVYFSQAKNGDENEARNTRQR